MANPGGGRDAGRMSGRWIEDATDDVEEAGEMKGNGGGVSYRDGPDWRRM